MKESSQICENLLQKSTKLINLIKVLNDDKYLSGLKSIDDIYNCNADIVEEIVCYHEMLCNHEIQLSNESVDSVNSNSDDK